MKDKVLFGIIAAIVIVAVIGAVVIIQKSGDTNIEVKNAELKEFSKSDTPAPEIRIISEEEQRNVKITERVERYDRDYQLE